MMAGKWKEVSGVSLAEEEGRAVRLNWEIENASEPWIAWLGHACFLIRWRGVAIVIDPVFNKWIGLIPRRVPVPDLGGLGRLDAALVSHGHMDHLNSGSLRGLDPRRIFIPAKTIGFLSSDLKERCEGVQVGAVLQVGEIEITVVEARHGGWRYPWQKGYIACGFVLSDGNRAIYAACDTAYGEHFQEIGRRWKVDQALLPVGAYSPQWFLQKLHLNPEEACLAAKDLGARRVIPFHFGSYRLSLEPLSEPLNRFSKAADENSLSWSLPYWL